MIIKDLVARMGKVDLEASVVDKSEAREFNKFGKAGKVCNAKIKDASGSVTLTLWNEQVDQVHVGDRIKITNGYVGEWQGELQLSTGKFGKLEILDNKGVTSDEETEADLLSGKTSDEGEHILTEDEAEEEELSEEPVDEEEVI